MTIRIKRATAADFTSGNPVLVAGQPAFEKDTKKIKVGDGVTAWVDLDYIAADSGPVAWADVTGKPTLFSGAYADLTGRPTLGTAAAEDASDFATAAQGAKADTALQPGAGIAWADVSGKPTFATVATSGSYADLSGKPTLGTAAAAATGDFATAAQGALAASALQPGASIPWTDVSGKPSFFSGAYADLTGLPTLFSGAYADLSGKPSTFTDVASGFVPASGGGATDLGYTASTRVLTSSTGTDVTLPLVTSGNPGLAPASGGGTSNFLRADGTWAAPPGGGGGSPLGLHDYWDETRFDITDVAAPPFLGAALASGTNNAAIPIAAVLGYNPGGRLLRSSASANSGYRYQTVSMIADYFGGGLTRKFRAQFLHLGNVACSMRFGFLDVTTVGNPTDGFCLYAPGSGAYQFIGFVGGVDVSGASVSPGHGRVMTVEIDVASDAASVRGRLWDGLNTTPILDQTWTANYPVGSSQLLGAGMTAHFGGTPPGVTDLGVLYSMGIGTVAGFERARG
jgi:hypothetical protein